ncbi:hypothetical protein ACFR97_14575 [Haloplanus litoreus]|uniref:Uncharacterized protein n=1 Tax=Haloplanus litoreus TaxID=767515 RepID=A0ABD5ZXE3_9EURY
MALSDDEWDAGARADSAMVAKEDVEAGHGTASVRPVTDDGRA